MEQTLVVSISGVRGIVGRGFDPSVVVRFAGAFAEFCRREGGAGSGGGARSGPQTGAASGRAPGPRVGAAVVVGRDARVSGELYADLTIATLRAAGCHVIDVGLASTPTVEVAVLATGAAGGIVLSASHNPGEWNALKLLNGRGEFLSPGQAQGVIDRANVLGGGAVRAHSGADSSSSNPLGDESTAAPEPIWADVSALGTYEARDFLDHHLDQILALPEINPDKIAEKRFKVLVDAVNSVGGIAIPALLRRLGVEEDHIVRLHCEPTGIFAHPAEPLPENLVETCAAVRDSGADIGLVVDPDADRLALIAKGGVYLSEELTQVLAADFWWKHHQGPFVTNLSSSRSIEDVAARHGQQVFRSAVGEINVVEKMKEVRAVIGGEGNGGVILPALHHGRDALVGAALILQHMADSNASLEELATSVPTYRMAKLKTSIGSRNPDQLLERIAGSYEGESTSTIDGVKIDFDEGWVHMRKSNTEPIIRVYAEARTSEDANALGERFMQELLA